MFARVFGDGQKLGYAMSGRAVGEATMLAKLVVEELTDEVSSSLFLGSRVKRARGAPMVTVRLLGRGPSALLRGNAEQIDYISCQGYVHESK
jgi:hypothetical protein